MKICPNCKKEYADTLGFCARCGSQLVDVQPIVEETTPVVPTTRFCMRCGNKINDSAAFCTACGTPVNAASGPSVKPNINVNDYINKIKANKNVTGFVETLKKYIKNPAEALNDLVKDGDVVAIAVPVVALFVSLSVFFLCLLSQVFYFEYGLELGLSVSTVMTLAFVLIPALTTFVAAKMNGKDYDIKGILSAASMNVCYLVPIFVLAGLVSLIEFWDFGLVAGIIVFVVGVFVKIFLSVSMLNQIAGNILGSVQSFWIPTGIATVLNAIVIGICGSILGNIIENILEELFYSSLW